jgi:hypothetical protein
MRPKLGTLLVLSLTAAQVAVVAHVLAADSGPSSFDPKAYPASKPLSAPARPEPVGKPIGPPPTIPPTTVVAPAAGGGDDPLSVEQQQTLAKLKGPDRTIIRDAMIRAHGKTPSFDNDLASLSEAVKAWRADAQVHLLGKLESGNPVFGSLVSRTGIATINNTTAVVRLAPGEAAQTIGAFR